MERDPASLPRQPPRKPLAFPPGVSLRTSSNSRATRVARYLTFSYILPSFSHCTLYVIYSFRAPFLPWQPPRSWTVCTYRIVGVSCSWHFVALENIVAIRSGMRNQTFVNRKGISSSHFTFRMCVYEILRLVEFPLSTCSLINLQSLLL